MTKSDFECQNAIFGPNLNVRIGFQMCILFISIMYLNIFLFADFEQRTLILISTDFRSYVLMKAVTAPHRTTAPVPGHFDPKPFRPGTPRDPPKLNF